MAVPEREPEPVPDAPAGAVYRELDVTAVEPNPQQPRTAFDEEALALCDADDEDESRA